MEGSTSDVSSGGEPTDGSIPFYSITNHHNNNNAHAQSTDVVLAQKSPSTMVFVSPTSAVALRLPIHRDSAPFADHDGDFAWTDEHAPLPPSVLTAKQTTLAPLCHDVLAMIIADFCDEQTARVMMATCRTLRYFCIAMDPVIWRPKCIEAWAGKMRFDPTLWRGAAEPETALAPVAAYPMSPASIRRHRSLDVDALTASATDSLLAFTQLPTTLVVLLRRAIKLSATPTPEHLVRHAGCSWRAAYHIARKDARRNFLTDDEVLEHRWEVEFLRRNPAAPAVPPPSEAVFVRDGLAKRVQPAPFLPFVPWQLHDSGRKVQVDVYPAHRVRRLDDTWGWSIENAYVRFYSVLRPP